MTSRSYGVSAIVLAAGRGSRVGADRNKAYLMLAGKPLVAHALDTLAASSFVTEILLVIAPGEDTWAAESVVDVEAPVRFVEGGVRRRDSALAGVLASTKPIVLIHDAARPFLSEPLIAAVVEGVRGHGACVPAVPVVDTLRYGTPDGLLGRNAISRGGLLRMQTPQGFDRRLILDSLTQCDRDVCDDAEAVLSHSEDVWTTPGDPTNIKITTLTDLRLAEGLAAALRRRDLQGD